MNKVTKMGISITTSLSLLLVSSSVGNFAHASVAEQKESDFNNKIKSYNQNGLSVDVEIVEGTVENWTKLKVTNHTEGTTEYLTKTSQGSKEIIDVEVIRNVENTIVSTGVQSVEKHQVVSENGDISVDGQSVVNETTSGSEQMRVANNVSNVTAANGTTWYFVSKIDGSVNTDVGTVGLCIAVLSAALGFAAAIITDSAIAIYGLKIPYTWYTKYKHSDKAPYRPLYRNEAYFFSDQLRTIQVGYSVYVV